MTISDNRHLATTIIGVIIIEAPTIKILVRGRSETRNTAVSNLPPDSPNPVHSLQGAQQPRHNNCQWELKSCDDRDYVINYDSASYLPSSF
eukprot:g38644.t1